MTRLIAAVRACWDRLTRAVPPTTAEQLRALYRIPNKALKREHVISGRTWW